MSFDLTNKNIQDTFQNLLQKTGSDNRLYDLTGNEIGDLRIAGSLTAQQYIVSSSVTNISIATLSGSTKFGDSTDDTHQFTGSVSIFTGTTGNDMKIHFQEEGTHKQAIVFQETTSPTFAIQHDGSDSIPDAQLKIRGNGGSGATIDTDLITIQSNGDTKFIGNITASGNISASGDIIATGTGSFSDGRFSGFVGIGNGGSAIAPEALLHLQNTEDDKYLQRWTLNNIEGGIFGDASGDVLKIQVNSNDALAFTTNATERVRIAKDGGTSFTSHITASGEISASDDIKGKNFLGKIGSFGVGVSNQPDPTIPSNNDIQLFVTRNGSTAQALIERVGNGELLLTAGASDVEVGTRNNYPLHLIHNNTDRVKIDAGGIDVIGHITASGNISGSSTSTLTLGGDITTNNTIVLPGDGGATQETIINAHNQRGMLKKQLNAVFWQVGQGTNQFEITDGARGNSTKGNVLLRTDGRDENDNKLFLVPDGAQLNIGGHITASGNISSSGTLISTNATINRIDRIDNAKTGVAFGDGINVINNSHITASGNISSSGNLSYQGATIHHVHIFTDGDTTPSVSSGTTFKTANTSGTDITGFDNGTAGQIIYIMIQDNNTDFTDGTNLQLFGGLDHDTAQVNDTISFICVDGTKWCELNRSDNT